MPADEVDSGAGRPGNPGHADTQLRQLRYTRYALGARSELTPPETKNFIYFYLGQIAVLLWKTS